MAEGQEPPGDGEHIVDVLNHINIQKHERCVEHLDQLYFLAFDRNLCADFLARTRYHYQLTEEMAKVKLEMRQPAVQWVIPPPDSANRQAGQQDPSEVPQEMPQEQEQMQYYDS